MQAILSCTIRDYNELLERRKLVHSLFDFTTLQMKGELFVPWRDVNYFMFLCDVSC